MGSFGSPMFCNRTKEIEMADYGYMEVTTDCPHAACDETVDVRVFGENGDVIYRTVECDSGHTYTAAITITVSGASSETEIT
jgi:hypothetical protein